MDWKDRFHGLYLDRDASDDEVDPIAEFERAPSIDGGQRHLSFEVNATNCQLLSETQLVRGFQQPGAKLTMNLDRRADDLVGEGIEFTVTPNRHGHVET